MFIFVDALGLGKQFLPLYKGQIMYAQLLFIIDQVAYKNWRLPKNRKTIIFLHGNHVIADQTHNIYYTAAQPKKLM